MCRLAHVLHLSKNTWGHNPLTGCREGPNLNHVDGKVVAAVCKCCQHESLAVRRTLAWRSHDGKGYRVLIAALTHWFGV